MEPLMTDLDVCIHLVQGPLWCYLRPGQGHSPLRKVALTLYVTEKA